MPRGLGVIALASWAMGVLIADQLTKAWVSAAIAPGAWVPLVGDLVRLAHTRNTGAAFNLLAHAPARLRDPVLIGVALAVCGALVAWRQRIIQEGRWAVVGYGCLGGGALGNVVDRIRVGSVLDFVDIGLGTWRWPAFNVADSAICIGVGMIILNGMRSGRSPQTAKPS